MARDDGQAAPKCIVVMMIGMAGSGKTTFHGALRSYLSSIGKRAYSVNLDPAVLHLPYEPQIDIRDTIDYKEVMHAYALGPNGAIMTALNLFATKFDQVLELLDKRAAEMDFVLIDTPGQIEVFNWSASGQIFTQALATSYTLVTAYILDTPRCSDPSTFMSNMLYACSILYKSNSPFLLVANKVDIQSDDSIREWMSSPDAYRTALQTATSYLSSLSRAMSMLLEAFYNDMPCCGVSSITGEGVNDSVREIQMLAQTSDANRAS